MYERERQYSSRNGSSRNDSSGKNRSGKNRITNEEQIHGAVGNLKPFNGQCPGRNWHIACPGCHTPEFSGCARSAGADDSVTAVPDGNCCGHSLCMAQQTLFRPQALRCGTGPVSGRRPYGRSGFRDLYPGPDQNPDWSRIWADDAPVSRAAVLFLHQGGTAPLKWRHCHLVQCLIHHMHGAGRVPGCHILAGGVSGVSVWNTMSVAVP